MDEEKNAKKTGSNNRRFLVVYTVSLLMIAFVLVLLSYFGQMRAQMQIISELEEEKESVAVSALQSVSDLQTQRDLLLEKVAVLEGQIAAQSAAAKEQTERVSELSAEVEKLEANLEESNTIGDLSWHMLNLYIAYDDKRYANAAEAVVWFEKIYVAEKHGKYLYGPNGPSREQYEETRDDLVKRGYLELDSAGEYVITFEP